MGKLYTEAEVRRLIEEATAPLLARIAEMEKSQGVRTNAVRHEICAAINQRERHAVCAFWRPMCTDCQIDPPVFCCDQEALKASETSPPTDCTG